MKTSYTSVRKAKTANKMPAIKEKGIVFFYSISVSSTFSSNYRPQGARSAERSSFECISIPRTRCGLSCPLPPRMCQDLYRGGASPLPPAALCVAPPSYLPFLTGAFPVKTHLSECLMAYSQISLI